MRCFHDIFDTVVEILERTDGLLCDDPKKSKHDIALLSEWYYLHSSVK